MSYRRPVRIYTLDGEEKGGRKIVRVVEDSDCAICALEKGEELQREQMYDNSGIKDDPWKTLKRNVMLYARLGVATGALQPNTEAKFKNEVGGVSKQQSAQTEKYAKTEG